MLTQSQIPRLQASPDTEHFSLSWADTEYRLCEN